MTTLREAAAAALEALENGKKVRAGEGGTKYQIPLEDNGRRCPTCPVYNKIELGIGGQDGQG